MESRLNIFSQHGRSRSSVLEWFLYQLVRTAKIGLTLYGNGDLTAAGLSNLGEHVFPLAFKTADDLDAYALQAADPDARAYRRGKAHREALLSLQARYESITRRKAL